jgi:hypothetical protein
MIEEAARRAEHQKGVGVAGVEGLKMLLNSLNIIEDSRYCWT